MNQINDVALLLKKDNLAEHHYLMTFFSKNHGILKSVLQFGNTSNNKNHNDLQIFNVFEIEKTSKNENDLGKIKVQLLKSFQSKFLFNSKNLYLVNVVNSLLLCLLMENEDNNEIYNETVKLIEKLSDDNLENLKNYYLYEKEILNYLGFSYDFSKCAITGKVVDLYYVSPNTGAGCEKSAGKHIADKLLVLPQFFIKNQKPSKEDLILADKLNLFFIKKNFNTANTSFLQLRENIIKTFGL